MAGLEVEPLGGAIPQDGRSERPKALPELDLEVHRGLHRRRSRVTQNAAGSECPGAELHAPLKPADDLALGQVQGDVLEQFGFIAKLLALGPLPCQETASLIGAVPRAQEAALLSVSARRWPGLFKKLVPDEQGRTQSPAGITGRRLNPEVVKVAFAEQPAVGDAVQRHSTGQHQVLHTGSLADMPADPEHDVLGHRLDAGGQVHVPLLEGRLGRRGADRRRADGTAAWSSSAPGNT